MASERPEKLNRDDALVNEEMKSERRAATRWEAFQSFHRAPCLKPSLGMGALGGLAIGLLRFLGGAGGVAALTWGGTTGTCLYGTSWYTCRRAMYARANNESNLIERMQAGDREAVKEYQELLERRQAKALEGHDGSGGWAKKVP